MFNRAQHLYLALGMDPWVLMFAAWKRRSPSFTKAGPGRRPRRGEGLGGTKRLARATGPNTYAERDRFVTLTLNAAA